MKLCTEGIYIWRHSFSTKKKGRRKELFLRDQGRDAFRGKGSSPSETGGKWGDHSFCPEGKVQGRWLASW